MNKQFLQKKISVFFHENIGYYYPKNIKEHMRGVLNLIKWRKE